ncbi:hypothetical protein ACIHFD_58810 [Nonomuraea sp. NPDC051941]|uniref:hypothetical protein n=1 Tax=Nonomuraea sp. NPDC051941 TaxID=3364373 RepID=UPI0037CB6A3F
MIFRIVHLLRIIFGESATDVASDLPLVVATVVVAFVGGVWLTAVVATATLSRLQRHMLEQVRHWQKRAIRAESEKRSASSETGKRSSRGKSARRRSPS